MEYIKSYFLNIIAVILFTVVVEILMPNTSLKGYIKLVLGLLVVFTVIKPIMNLANVDFSTFLTTDEVIIVSSQVEEVQNSQINNLFCEKLETTIAEDIQNNFNQTVSVDVDADVNEIRKITVLGASKEKENDVATYILNIYGVENVCVGR